MYQLDSRKIQPQDTFICLPGGEFYIQDALNRGAKEVLKFSRKELAHWACEHYGFPSEKLQVIGVTGTNGKTTVTQWVTQALVAAGYNPYVLGTLNAALTTPESLDIQRLMAQHVAQGGTHFVMEVSSHAIAQSRIEGIHFAVKLLTNITQDHLDYHKTFEAYKQTKLSFMSEGTAIFPEKYEALKIPFSMPVLGAFNLKNMQATLAILGQLNIDPETYLPCLSQIKAPSGRFEAVDVGQPFHVIVDYAHTPDGLQNVLQEAQRLARESQGRVITVFGCGGDRDRGKRPLMANIAATFSESVILTSDNPRTESPTQIFQDIEKGFPARYPYTLIEDRHQAIEKALAMAKKGDVVMIAGKGHETYQLIQGQTFHFDDKEEAQKGLKKLGYPR